MVLTILYTKSQFAYLQTLQQNNKHFEKYFKMFPCYSVTEFVEMESLKCLKTK